MVEKFDSEVLMFSGSTLHDDEVNTKTDQLSTGRRGQWGNLWFTED